MAEVKLQDMIKFDQKSGLYVVASQYSPAQVDDMLRQVAYESQAGYDLKETHELLAQNIVEPIRQTVPYVEMYSPLFFMNHPIGDLEDPAIPIEDIPTVAWETHRDGEVMFVRANYRWTRPETTTWDVGIEVAWSDLRKAGWNYLARQMKYATENLARKRDVACKAVLDAAFIAAHLHTIAGGVLTRASIKAVLKAADTIGFPMTQCLLNAGTATDMAEWTFPTGQQIDPGNEGLMTNLYLATYGGCRFVTNPHASTTECYFAGPTENTGWHIEQGTVQSFSDVDIRHKIDLHSICDSDHGWYVGNAYNMRKLTVSA